MKKTFKTLLFLATPLLLVGCGKTTDPYTKVNTALGKKYATFAVKIETSYDVLKLTSTYAFSLDGNNYQVQYVEEKMNQVSFTTTSSQKTIERGTKTVAASDVNFDKFLVKGSTYKEIEYDVKGTFLALVSDPKTFLNLKAQQSVEDMHMQMAFGDIMESIVYSYDASDCSTVVTYNAFTE